MLSIAQMDRQNDPKSSGSGSAGQSGADQGLSEVAEADSESVKELVQEGQSFEANVVDAIEKASEPDAAEVRTRQFPEDDVPPEYLERDWLLHSKCERPWSDEALVKQLEGRRSPVSSAR